MTAVLVTKPYELVDYFDFSEFDSPDEPGSGKLHMSQEFLRLIIAARIIAGIPFKVESGYRTIKHNKDVGGKSGSSHPKGFAIDIRALGDNARFEIVDALMRVGFKRIGIGDNFIHVDCDPNKSQRVMWVY